MILKKICARCECEKFDFEFHANRKTGKLRPHCKECNREINREYTARNKTETRPESKTINGLIDACLSVIYRR